MTTKELTIIDETKLEDYVYEISGFKVMLDFDLAKIYGYTTKTFNQQIRNNKDKFPSDFRFKLTPKEVNDISKSQSVTTMKRVGGHITLMLLQNKVSICL